ncbi:MAG TPA: hypothetical protein VER78_03930, partial [Thermoanaerobaculia bacterium]|nr:hypothetical protein [Thermoanaerobaculia bacterium]
MPAIGCLAMILAGASVARAHGPNGTLSDPAYQEMRRLARQLDGQAQHASDQAQHEQYYLYQRDRTFTRAVANFARRASQFNYRMGTYRTQPWQVDDELRILLRSARDVQSRVRRSRYTDEHTLSDWNEVVNVLNRMMDLYESDTSGAGRYGNRQPYGSPGYRPEPYGRPGESGYSRQPGPGGYG